MAERTYSSRARQARKASFVVLLLMAGLFATGASAQDRVSAAAHDVVTAQDFRLRVSAALRLGRTHDPRALAALDRALDDPHPAVRTAAAAALGALGDAAAIPSLKRHEAKEPVASVKAQIRTTIESLHKSSTLQGVQLVVQVGAMRNLTRVRGGELAEVLRNATASRARAMSNVAVAMPGDQAVLARAAQKHLPVVQLDGAVTHLTQSRSRNVLSFSAQVEFSVRKIPEQTIKGTMSGAATTMGQGATSRAAVVHLENQAVDSAVESALRGADQVVLAAR